MGKEKQGQVVAQASEHQVVQEKPSEDQARKARAKGKDKSALTVVRNSAGKAVRVVVDTTKSTVFWIYCGATSLIGGVTGFSVGMAVGGPICRYLSDLYSIYYYGSSPGALTMVGRYATANIATQYGGVIFFGVLGEIAGLAGGAYAGYKGAVMVGNLSSKTWTWVSERWQNHKEDVANEDEAAAKKKKQAEFELKDDYFSAEDLDQAVVVQNADKMTAEDFAQVMQLFQYSNQQKAGYPMRKAMSNPELRALEAAGPQDRPVIEVLDDDAFELLPAKSKPAAPSTSPRMALT